MSPALVLAMAAAVTAAVVGLGWWANRRGVLGRDAITAIALAAAYAAGSWFVFGAPRLWPADAVGFSIPAGWAGAALAMQPWRTGIAGLSVVALVGGALGFVVLHGRILHDWHGMQGVIAVARAAVVYLATHVQLRPSPRPDQPASSRSELVELLELAVLAAGTAAAGVLSGTIKIAFVAGMVASSLAVIAVAYVFVPRAVSTCAASSLAGLAIVTCWLVAFAYAAMPTPRAGCARRDPACHRVAAACGAPPPSPALDRHARAGRRDRARARARARARGTQLLLAVIGARRRLRLPLSHDRQRTPMYLRWRGAARLADHRAAERVREHVRRSRGRSEGCTGRRRTGSRRHPLSAVRTERSSRSLRRFRARKPDDRDRPEPLSSARPIRWTRGRAKRSSSSRFARLAPCTRERRRCRTERDRSTARCVDRAPARRLLRRRPRARHRAERACRRGRVGQNRFPDRARSDFCSPASARPRCRRSNLAGHLGPARFRARSADPGGRVVGADDDLETLFAKADWYLGRGVAIVWIVDGDERRVHVVTGADRAVVRDRIPESPLLPGLSPAVSSFFRQL